VLPAAVAAPYSLVRSLMTAVGRASDSYDFFCVDTGNTSENFAHLISAGSNALAGDISIFRADGVASYSPGDRLD
jgi:hypothetical protein